MQSLWDEAAAERAADKAEEEGLPRDLSLRVYSSRLIGRDPDLVLHGGGNTSVKIGGKDGILYVKGSGWDLATIEAPGLPGLKLSPLQAVRGLAPMSDDSMVAFLRGELIDPSSPNPSVETLLHAFLPAPVVDHVHATAILALADQEDMEADVARIFDGRLAFVPYVMPGYDLAMAGDRVFRANPDVEGLWLAKHGLFTWGSDARESYERTVAFVTMAEKELGRRGAIPSGPQTSDAAIPGGLAKTLSAALLARRELGPAPALDFRSTPAIRTYLARVDFRDLASRGTATPDHVIRLKPFPMILAADAGEPAIDDALDRYAAAYGAYFERHVATASEPKIMLDPLPRAVLVPDVGLFGLGRNEKEAGIVADLWEQTARIVPAAESWGRFSPISERDLFDMEYWSLEQAKLNKA